MCAFLRFSQPNFANMEEYRLERGADKVVGFVPTGWVHQTKSTAGGENSAMLGENSPAGAFPVHTKGSCQFAPPVGEFSHNIGEFSPIIGEFPPPVGEFSPPAGEFSPNIGEFSPIVGEFSPII
eukprot:6189448-Pyramimonas_sp.AAC.1